MFQPSSNTFARPARVPDFFIVGAAKAATTSLAAWLADHPAVYVPPDEKEPGYFCDYWGYDDPEKYSALYRRAQPGQLTCDATASYLACPVAAAGIKEANPDARIIISLRNPAERAFSLYLQMLKTGHEVHPTFEEALEAEDRERADNPEWLHVGGYIQNYLYFRSGLYSAQVQRFLDAFDRSRILFLKFEQIIRQPEDAMRQVTDFLGIAPMDNLVPERKNPGRVPKNSRLQHFIKRHAVEPLDRPAEHGSGPQRRLALAARSAAYRLMEWNLTDQNLPRLSSTVRQTLLDRYAEDIRKTEALTGLSLASTWLAPKTSK